MKSMKLWCRHKHISWPLQAHKGDCYVVCHDCGREFNYDWLEMRITGPRVTVTQKPRIPLEPERLSSHNRK